MKLLDYGDFTIFRDEEILLIEGVCEQETIKVIKCHKPQISSNNLKIELKKATSIVIACGPFNAPQNAECKKLLGYVLHEVRLWLPDFLILMGPLIIEREGQKLKDEYLK